MGNLSRFTIGVMLAFVLFLLGLGLIGGPGLYGLTLFMLIPMALGGLGAWLFRPATRWRAAGVGALTAGACAASLLALGLEGAACILMALPLVLPLGAMGGLLGPRCYDRQVCCAGRNDVAAASDGSAHLGHQGQAARVRGAVCGRDRSQSRAGLEIRHCVSASAGAAVGSPGTPVFGMMGRTSGSSAQGSPIRSGRASTAQAPARCAAASSPPGHSSSRSRSGTLRACCASA